MVKSKTDLLPFAMLCDGLSPEERYKLITDEFNLYTIK